jgi:hypothetical protein
MLASSASWDFRSVESSDEGPPVTRPYNSHYERTISAGFAPLRSPLRYQVVMRTKSGCGLEACDGHETSEGLVLNSLVCALVFVLEQVAQWQIRCGRSISWLLWLD